ncbi:MAG: hypothetical protein AAFX09_11030 [Pseudomonadota bacterium]
MSDIPEKPSQADKFRKLADELECDEDEGRFEGALKRVAKVPKSTAPKLSDETWERFERGIGRNNRDKS